MGKGTKHPVVLHGASTLRSRHCDSDGGPAFVKTGPTCNGRRKKTRILSLIQINWQKFQRSGNPAVAFWLSSTLVLLLISTQTPGTNFAFSIDQDVAFFPESRKQIQNDLPIRIPIYSGRDLTEAAKDMLPKIPKIDDQEKQFGGLNISIGRNSINRMVDIRSNTYEEAESYRKKLLSVDEGRKENYYQPAGGKDDDRNECRTPGWVHYTYPSCNLVHEKPIERYNDQSFHVTFLK